MIEGVVCGDWKDFVARCSTANWREALVASVTYASNEEFSAICTSLGNKLSGQAAMLCFICAGDLDRVVECWMKTRDTSSGPKVSRHMRRILLDLDIISNFPIRFQSLQDLVEVVMSLKSALERLYGSVNINSGPLSEKLTQYASLLAAQGALSAALGYLGDSDEESIKTLRERLSGALGQRNVVSRKTSQMSQYQRPGSNRSSGKVTKQPHCMRNNQLNVPDVNSKKGSNRERCQ